MSVIPKQQVYQMWASDGTYLGVLQGVTSEYKKVQDINTLGPSSIEVKVSMKLDTAIMPVKAITTEDGLWITTESGVGLTTEGEQPNFAVDKSKIRNGNILKITEISPYHPNGIIVFSGKVKKWRVNFGTTDDARLTVSPLSIDMNSKLVKSGPVASITQLTGSNTFTIGSAQGGRYGYAFDFAGAGVSSLDSVTLKLAATDANPVDVSLSIVDLGPATSGGFSLQNFSTPALATASVSVITSTSPTEYMFNFPAPLFFETNRYYGLVVGRTNNINPGTSPILYFSSSDVNVFGAQYHNDLDGLGWKFGANTSGDITGDLWFRFFTIPPFTKATVTNFEPSALLKVIINNYNAEGGVVKYTSTSIESTGISVPTYTFQTNTVAEGLDILLKLSPPGFYYTIDPGTNIITFKRVKTTADHVLIFRDNIQSLDLSASIEKLRNDIYFTGGLVGSTNTFVNRKNQTSIANFGNELDRISDINVTDISVASSIALNYLDKIDDEIYETTVEIVDGATDITQYNLGETIGFANFGNFADTVIIPIVRISRDMNVAELSLGSVAVRQSDIIQDASEDVLALTTVANPNQPS